MEERIDNLRRMYERFRKGKEDVFVVKAEAILLLEEAKRSKNQEILNEIEDMLIDLQFSIEEEKCKCHSKCDSC